MDPIMLCILVWYAVRGFKDAAASQARHELGAARGFIRREVSARMAPVLARMEAGRRAGHTDPWWWLHHGVRSTRAAWAGSRAAARASLRTRRAARRVIAAGRQGAREAAATRRAGLPYQPHGVCPHCGAVVPAGWIGPASCLTCTPEPAPAAEVAEPEPVPASGARKLAVVPDAEPAPAEPAAAVATGAEPASVAAAATAPDRNAPEAAQAPATQDPADDGAGSHTSPGTGADSITNEKGTAMDTIISAPGVDGDAGSDLASTKGASTGIDGMATNLVQEIDAILGNLQGKRADARVIAYFTEMQELAAELVTKAEGAGGLLEGVHSDIADVHAAAGHENVADQEWYQEA